MDIERVTKAVKEYYHCDDPEWEYYAGEHSVTRLTFLKEKPDEDTPECCVFSVGIREICVTTDMYGTVLGAPTDRDDGYNDLVFVNRETYEVQWKERVAGLCQDERWEDVYPNVVIHLHLEPDWFVPWCDDMTFPRSLYSFDDFNKETREKIIQYIQTSYVQSQVMEDDLRQAFERRHISDRLALTKDSGFRDVIKDRLVDAIKEDTEQSTAEEVPCTRFFDIQLDKDKANDGWCVAAYFPIDVKWYAKQYALALSGSLGM